MSNYVATPCISCAEQRYTEDSNNQFFAKKYIHIFHPAPGFLPTPHLVISKGICLPVR